MKNPSAAVLVRESADGIAVLDGDGVVVFANPEAERLLGGHHASGESEGAVGRCIGFPAVGDSPTLLQLRSAENEELYVEMRAVETEWNGKRAFVVNLRNVTERIHATDQLRFQAKLLASVGDAVIVTDSGGRITYWNRAAEGLYGWSAEEVIGRQIESVTPAAGATEAAATIMDTLRQGEKWSGEFMVTRKDGSTFPARVTDTPIIGAAGAVEAIIGISSDMTEMHAAHERATQSLRRTAEIVESILDGFLAVDDSFTITYFNHAAERILGVPREMVVSRDLFDVFPVELGAKFRERMDRWMCSRTRMSFESFSEASNNWYEFRIYPSLKGASVFFSVITDRKLLEKEAKELEEQLQQIQKMDSIGRMAGGIAHDFNNILQAMTGYAELLRLRAADDDRVTDIADQLRSAGERGARLTRQLLGFARKQTIVPRELDMNDTVSSLLKMIRRVIGEDIDLQWKPGTGLWHVYIDPGQVDQILVNLAVNARDAINGTGTLIFQTDNHEVQNAESSRMPGLAPGAYVRLFVRDSGIGMERSVMDRIFEPFFTTKPQGAGTGLGLSTVYGIVKQNNGYITVESEPGKGSTFVILLPRVESRDPDESQDGQDLSVPGGTETILVVEDEVALLEITRDLLRNLGYTVLTASGPGEALDVVSGHLNSIALALIDVVMPQMSGPELFRKISESRQDIKCLFVSGYATETFRKQGIRPDESNLLKKPFTRSELAKRIRDVLDASSTRE